jgi:hypothetical protein
LHGWNMKVYIKDEDVISTIKMHHRKFKSLLESCAKEGTFSAIEGRELSFEKDDFGWFVEFDEKQRDILFRRFDTIYGKSKLKEEMLWL